MNIAITGSTGLLGFNLTNYYAKMGHNVFVLLRDEFYKVKLEDNVNKIYGNINSKQDVDYFIQKSLPDRFIHLAAQTQAYDSLKYPYNTFYTNIIGTLNVLESLREYGKCSAIVIASSDKAYGELQGKEYLESHALNGVYPYDASKSMTDMVSFSYKKTYGMPIATTRACNMYGPGDSNQERLIPGIINCYIEDKVFNIRNNGEDIREYIYIDDVVSAYDHILKYIESGGDESAFNISSNDRYSTMEVFNSVNSYLENKTKFEISTAKSLEIRKQFMNSKLLKDKTGWLPSASFNEKIKETVDWYINFLGK